MTETILLALLLAALGGLLAGRAWARARHRSQALDRSGFRGSIHWLHGLDHLAAGRPGPALRALSKVARDFPESFDLQVVLGRLLRETGQAEKSIQIHQSLARRPDLNRTEHSFVLSSLGEDYRRAGILDRARRAFDDAMEADSRNIHAVAGHQKLLEDQGLWTEAAEERLRLARLRRSDDSLVLAFLRTEEGHLAARSGRSEAAEHLYRQALALDYRIFPARLGRAAVLAPPRRSSRRRGPREGGGSRAPEGLSGKRAPVGGSTISQQLVKNLYLTPSKNPLRKAKEAIITWRLEKAINKRRILELYLNVVEWGEGIFGIEVAAQHYYSKSASALSALRRLPGSRPCYLTQEDTARPGLQSMWRSGQR